MGLFWDNWQIYNNRVLKDCGDETHITVDYIGGKITI